MREKILTFIEKNSRVDLKELAIMLGVNEVDVSRAHYLRLPYADQLGKDRN